MDRDSDTILIGVDGGGTGCRVALGTAAQGIMATSSGGPANATTQADVFLTNIRSAVSQAAEQVGFSDAELRRATAHVGLAGVMTEAQSEQIATDLGWASIRVTDDRFTTLTGVLGGQDGFLVSVGTGTIIARMKNGRVRSVGGWGFHVSDQASGAWLGRGLLEQVLMCHDGVQHHSPLTHEILNQFDGSPAGIVSFSTAAKPADYATFAPQIVAADRAGDTAAKRLMRGGVDYVVAALQALGYQPGDRLCITGGLGPSYMVLLSADGRFEFSKAKGTALDGAFRLAAELAQGEAP